MFVPMRSRTSRYARFDSRRNHAVAHASGGTSTSVQAASSGLSTRTAITAPTNSSAFWTIDTRPCDTRSWSESMSDVMRATSWPVFSRS